MPTLHVELPEELNAKLTARAVDAGFPSIEHYARAVLEASAEGQADVDELEDLLHRRATDPTPGIEFTPSFVKQFKRNLDRRRGMP